MTNCTDNGTARRTAVDGEHLKQQKLEKERNGKYPAAMTPNPDCKRLGYRREHTRYRPVVKH